MPARERLLLSKEVVRVGTFVGLSSMGFKREDEMMRVGEERGGVRKWD